MNVFISLLVTLQLGASPEDVRRDLQEAGELMDSARTLVARGDTKGSKKRLGEAEALYKKVLSDNVEQRDAAVGLASVYFLQKRYDAGVELMRPFHDRLPDDADVTHQLGMHLYRAGQQGLAVPLLEKVAREAERFDAAWLLALHYYRQGEWDLGLPHAEHYHKARPDDVESLALIGTYYLKASRFEDAVRVLDAYLAKNPDNVAAGINRANALFRKGEVDKAGQAYEQLLVKFPDRSRFLYNLAAVRIKQNRCQDALPLLEKFLQHEPKNGPGLYFRADCLLKLERWADAKEAFSRAGEQGPSNPWVFYGLSKVALQNGDQSGAVDNAKQAADLGTGEALLAAWYGTLLRRIATRPAEALIWHDKAVKLDETDATWHVERGRDLWALTRFEDAQAAFDAALARDGHALGAREGAAASRTAIAVRVHAGGDTALATQLLNEALGLAPSYGPARANLAMLAIARGEVAVAKTLLDEAPAESQSNADTLAAAAVVRLMTGDFDGAAVAASQARAAGTAMLASVAEVEGFLAARQNNWDKATKAFEEAAAIATRPALDTARAQAWLELGLERLTRGEGAARDALGRASRLKGWLDKDDQTTIEFALQALGVVTADNGEQAAKAMATTVQSAKYAAPAWARVRDIGFGYAAYGYLKAKNAAEARKMLDKVRDRAALGPAWEALATAADDVEARRAFQGGDYAAAERIWAQMAGRGVSDPGLENNLAAARFMQGKTAQAEAGWRPLADQSVPVEALFNLGNALGRKGEHRASWDLLRRYVGTGGAAAALKDRVDAKARLFGFRAEGP